MIAPRYMAAPLVAALALSGCATIRGFANADDNAEALAKGVAALTVLQGETYATLADLVDAGEMTPATASDLASRVDEAGAYLLAARTVLTDGPGDIDDARRYLALAATTLTLVREQVEADE